MKKNNSLFLWLISLLLLLGIHFFGDVVFGSSQNLSEVNENPMIKNDNAILPIFPTPENSIQKPPGNVEFFKEEPIALILPLPGDPPISFWRPPLYPTPWAISPNDHFFFSRPIAADEINWPLANYRYGYFFPDTDIIHTGIDITARRGTPVIAAAPGTVIWAGYGLYYGSYNEEDPYGMAVTIEHDFGHKDKKLMTVYGHMDRIDVIEGQRVETGTQLGIVGNTGFTTGPHLHFEVRIENNSYFRTRNPELWLSPPQGWGVLVGQLRSIDNQYINLEEVYIRNRETNQSWMVLTYASNSINRDEYYKENLVLSDLPSGEYTLSFSYDGVTYRNEFTIYPGAISFISFHEKNGFSDELPPITNPQEWQNIVLTGEFLP
jgi:murein DD-endopeptidase MepM/ murein hydrolase activator NlpD